ncbi:4'-phosphopantetheinyl transferase [Corynebacterium sp. LK2510]|uniref:4'-phosphopantetheinyl transferase n=1 Tax=Corynebacterium sp. LK2510 TaxID=3110472 RepID=UPI0034CF43B3
MRYFHDLFPPQARFVYVRTDDDRDLTNYRDLDPREQEIVSRAFDVRKGEFGDARWCAHQALKELGVSDQEAILRGDRGMPLWPSGYTGSLTHTEGFRAAVAVSTDHVVSIGVDAEPAQPLPGDVIGQIMRERERVAVERMRERGMDWANRLIFCAKEATYKCWFPMTRRFIDFHEAEVDLREDGTFIVYILARPTPIPFFEGRWMERGGYILTSAFVTQAQAARFKR